MRRSHDWRHVHAIRQSAGVGDQDPRCTHTDGLLPCPDCFFDGADAGAEGGDADGRA